MSKVLVTEDYLGDIADAIRGKLSDQTQYKPGQMAAAIESIPTGTTPTGTINITENGNVDVTDYATANVSVSPNLQSKTATENGTVTPDSGYDGLSSVVVNVSGGGGGIITGSDAPSSSQGSDGDVYKRVMPIPSNVSFVSYIESSATQYIDTGIIGNQDTEYSFDYENITPAWRFGARTAAQSNSIVITPATSTATSSEYVDLGSDRFTISSLNSRRKIELKNGIVYVDGTPYNRYRYARFTTPSTILIFAVHNGNTVNNSGSTRVYRATIYQDGAPVADYLPCLDGNGVACLWDNVAGEYVYNDGTGSFTYGSTVTPDALDPVYYVKKNGAWEVIQ